MNGPSDSIMLDPNSQIHQILTGVKVWVSPLYDDPLTLHKNEGFSKISKIKEESETYDLRKLFWLHYYITWIPCKGDNKS